MRKLILILFILFLEISLGKSQEYYAHRYTIYDGLPSQEVYDMVQDSLGRMLFVTRGDFLISYNGFQWRRLTPHFPKKRSGGMIYRIEIDKKNILWRVDYNPFSNIYYLKGNTWHSIRIPDTLNLDAMRPLSLQIAYPKGQPSVLILLANRNLLLWENNRFYYFNKKNSPTKFIQEILSVNDQFYVLDITGLYKFAHNQLKKIYLPPKLEQEHFYSFCRNTDNSSPPHSPDLLLLTGQHVLRWQNRIVQKIPLNVNLQKFPRFQRYKILPDGFGGFFIGSALIFKHFNAYLNKWEDVRFPPNYKHIGIYDMLRDRENNYWFTTSRGIFKIPSLRFLNFSRGQNFPDEVTSIHEFYPGHYFIASTNAFTIYDGHHFKLFKFSHHRDEYARILSAINDPSSNRILAAVSNFGIIKIAPGGQFSVLPSPQNSVFNCIIAELNKKDSFLIGSSTGLWKLHNNVIKHLDIPILNKAYIRKIYRARDHSLYLASVHHGIYKINDGDLSKVKNITHKIPQANNIYAISELENGHLLLGTLIGLYELQGDSIFKSTLFPNKIPIYSILIDKQNNIWLGSDQGVYIIRADSKEVTHFDVRHGLAGMECNRDALYLDKQGHILIGTDNGFSLYQPLYDTPAPPPILAILNKAPQNNSFSPNTENDDWLIKLSCISFKDERNISLRYRLKGLEAWNVIKKLRNTQIPYWKLPPGTYQFQVQAQNVEGHWSPIIKSETFHIYAPFWKRWYFLLVSVLIFIGLAYFFTSMHYNTKLNDQLKIEIKERTRALKKSEEKYRQLFMNSLDGIFITTPEGKFIDINPAGVEFFGYKNKDALLKVDIPKDLYVNPDDRERFKKEMEANGRVHNFEVDFKRKDGKVVTAVLSSTCIYDDKGNIVAYSGYIRDITEWKKMRQQLAHSQRMESLGMLAGGIAHDFNNILAGILGYASLMKLRMKPDDKLFRYADIIEKSAQRAAELTNQLLIFSRRGQSKLSAVNISKAIEEALKIISPTFPKTIKLNINLPENLPNVLADPTQMQQIIINLAVNARDALIDGEGEITISACPFSLKIQETRNHLEAKPGEYVCIRVKDTGIGMPEDIKHKIFEPFFSTKPKGKGTGMGLAMVYGAIRNLGGFIQVDSKVNQGTTFSLYFPVYPFDPDEPETDKEQTPLNGTEKILVVDDEEMIRNFCKLALEKYGYQIILAENGMQALDVLKESSHEIDLIILDMIMPVLDGSKTYAKIRQTNKTLPFLISSGYSDADKLTLLEGDPLVQVIYKPYKAKELIQTVRKFLDSLNHNPRTKV